jgi:hypothetical protein
MPRAKKELKHPNIVVNNDTEEPLSVIVSSLHKVADGITQINESGLNERAIVLLLHDMTRVPKENIRSILGAAPRLVERYTTTKVLSGDAEE